MYLGLGKANNMSKSVSVVMPLFNRDRRMVDFVINDMLNQDVDEIVLANTGEKRYGYQHPRIREVHQPLPAFYPGITRNMGAVIASGEVQVHSGLDIITASGSWTPFRDVQDNEMVCGQKCIILASQADTEKAYSGCKNFPKAFVHSPNRGAAQAITKSTILFILKGFDWEMRGWGRVDTDLYCRAEALKMTRRFIPLTTIHLWHPGGCTGMVYGNDARKSPIYKHNASLLNAKCGKARGWWSGIAEARA